MQHYIELDIPEKRHKLRMFRRYLMKLTYAGADTWRLTKTAQKALNHWTAQKVCHIAGATLKEESKTRSVHTVNMLRQWRHRRVGQLNLVRVQSKFPKILNLE